MAQPNGLNPWIGMLKLGSSGGVWITSSSTSYDDTTIAAEIGTPGPDLENGSIYIGTNATTPGIWIAVAGTWTQLNVN